MRAGRLFAICISLLFLAAIASVVYIDRTFQRPDDFLATAKAQLQRKLLRATPRAPDFGLPPPHLHETLGRLEIPRLHLSVPLVEGADDAGLRLGAAHIIGTGLPGTSGNVGIAAHRDTWFRPLRLIHSGDLIVLRTKFGTFQYEAQRGEIVNPDKTGVLASAGRPELTLVTCYPFYYVGHAPKRFILHAREKG